MRSPFLSENNPLLAPLPMMMFPGKFEYGQFVPSYNLSDTRTIPPFKTGASCVLSLDQTVSEIWLNGCIMPTADDAQVLWAMWALCRKMHEPSSRISREMFIVFQPLRSAPLRKSILSVQRTTSHLNKYNAASDLSFSARSRFVIAIR